MLRNQDVVRGHSAAWSDVTRWIAACCPEVPKEVRQQVFSHGLEEEDCGWYELLCMEEADGRRLQLLTELRTFRAARPAPGTSSGKDGFGPSRTKEELVATDSAPARSSPMTLLPPGSAGQADAVLSGKKEQPTPAAATNPAHTTATAAKQPPAVQLLTGTVNIPVIDSSRVAAAPPAERGPTLVEPSPAQPAPGGRGRGRGRGITPTEERQILSNLQRMPVLAPMAGPKGVAMAGAEQMTEEEDVAFLLFQEEMETRMGFESQRNQSELEDLYKLQSFDETAQASRSVHDVLLSRASPSQIPGFDVDDDLVVTRVYPNSPAMFAGVGQFVGHRLVSVEGIPVAQTSDLAQFWKQTELWLGFSSIPTAPPLLPLEDQSPRPPSPPPIPNPPPLPEDEGVAPPPPPPPQAAMPRLAAMEPVVSSFNMDAAAPPAGETGYVFVRGFGEKLDSAHAIILHMIECDPSECTIKLIAPATRYGGAALIELPSPKDAEIAAETLHGQYLGHGEIKAFLVWPCRGDPDLKRDIVEEVNGVLVNIGPVATKSPKTRPRNLAPWEDPTGGVEMQDVEIEDEGNIGAWNQFQANETLGVGPTTYRDDLYTTQLDPALMDPEKLKEAERIAEWLQNTTRDSLLPPDGAGHGDDEEARHSAVLPSAKKPVEAVLAGGLEAEGQPAEWDQFAANAALKGGKPAGTGFVAEDFTTKLDYASLTPDQREKAARLAKAMGECTQDSMQEAGAEEEDEDKLLSIRMRSAPAAVGRSRVILVSALPDYITGEAWMDACGDFGAVEQVAVFGDRPPNVDPSVLAPLNLPGNHAVSVFAAISSAVTCASEFEGAALDPDSDARLRTRFLYEIEGADPQPPVATFGDLRVGLRPPGPPAGRSLKPWAPPLGDTAAMSARGELAGEVGEWDQFEANKKLGVPESTYSDNLYTTALPVAGVTDAMAKAAEKIAREIGEGARDSLLSPDGEGDGQDEEARHSAVLRPGEFVAGAGKRAAVAKDATPKADSSVFFFVRGLGQGRPESLLRELLESVSLVPVSSEVLDLFRHPPGVAIIEVKQRDATKALDLHNRNVNGGTLLCKLVMPAKTVDSDEFQEEYRGVILDLSRIDT
ncbi:hypothetical protein DIPPA_14428 [Diplonema papillatum]|nr:hypothetical protein DIPPA_14428 [Diplonema papillatum]